MLKIFQQELRNVSLISFTVRKVPLKVPFVSVLRGDLNGNKAF